ncbi:HEPN domain-containing protein [Polaribacter gochangensis]|uniref:HEPN domain-containing protein n=1 Tax=Polaribacter gochangensis TaxID=3252903 RepID=UPI003904910F
MNNASVKQSIDDCSKELEDIQKVIDVFGQSHSIVPFLTNYAIIKCCGTIENSFKSVIADFHNKLPSQAKNYIDSTFTNSSMNPSKDNICRSLKRFDENWNTSFKEKLDLEPNKSQIDSSLKSLNDARNEFAHGGHPKLSFGSVKTYFCDSQKIIEILDDIIK